MYVVSYFSSGRLPLGTSVCVLCVFFGGGQQGEKGVAGRGEVVGQLSERVKACSQTVGEASALPLIHTGAYNLQHVINHCCVWG